MNRPWEVCGEKRQYRREIWSTLERLCPVARKDAQVLLMPSREGVEIENAIRKGFRESNIHAVDQNAAMIARQRQLGGWPARYPKINVYGNELGRACERMAQNGTKIAVANFDLCGNLGRKVALTLRNIAATGVLADRAAITITLLRGREAAAVNELNAEEEQYLLRSDNEIIQYLYGLKTGDLQLKPRDLLRAMAAFQCLGFGLRCKNHAPGADPCKVCPDYLNPKAWTLHRIAGYRSSEVTMLWVAGMVHPQSESRPSLVVKNGRCELSPLWGLEFHGATFRRLAFGEDELAEVAKNTAEAEAKKKAEVEKIFKASVSATLWMVENTSLDSLCAADPTDLADPIISAWKARIEAAVYAALGADYVHSWYDAEGLSNAFYSQIEGFMPIIRRERENFKRIAPELAAAERRN